jgi:hypothetical protein
LITGDSVFDLKDFSDTELLDVSVLAGQFPWDIWLQLPSASQSKAAPPCLLMAVHPLDRVMSLFYRSCFHDPLCPHHHTAFNDLTAQALASFISVSGRADTNRVNETSGEDAMCRAFASRRGVSTRHEDLDFAFSHTDLEQATILENVGTCVVGLQSDWVNTKKVIAHWFPWMEVETALLRRPELAEAMDASMADLTIRPELRQIVEEMNRCDLKLFEQVRSLFEKQLLVISTKAYL